MKAFIALSVGFSFALNVSALTISLQMTVDSSTTDRVPVGALVTGGLTLSEEFLNTITQPGGYIARRGEGGLTEVPIIGSGIGTSDATYQTMLTVIDGSTDAIYWGVGNGVISPLTLVGGSLSLRFEDPTGQAISFVDGHIHIDPALFTLGALHYAAPAVGNLPLIDIQASAKPREEPVAATNLFLRMLAGLTITGKVGRTYRIESSTNSTNWTTETNLLLNASPFQWIDQSPVSGNKFYRAFLLP